MRTRRIRGAIWLVALAAGLVAMLAASPALAISCSQWTRLTSYQKADTVDGMIHSALSSSAGRQYRVDRGAIERCLYASAYDIERDFDGVCADSRSASMQALNAVFKDYIWSCVR